MYNRLLTRLIVATAAACMALLAPVRADAQAVAQPEEYRFDAGVGLGMTGYLGDLNTSGLFSHPGFGGNLSFRYLANTRLAIRTLLSVESLSGSTKDMENVIPGIGEFDFKSSLYDLTVRGEFNFFNYGIGHTYQQLKRCTPYIALGLGVSLATGDAESAVAMSLPMAVGVKFKLKPRLNLGLEFCMTKLFGDRADSPLLDDPYMIKSSFLKNTDWSSSLMLSISYEFGRRCVACNRQD